jgi:PIN domain nuclease of toxin-antitoxin system
MLIAQAQFEKLILLTADKALTAYGTVVHLAH